MRIPFFSSHDDRVMLARKRYFEEGESPSGIVGDAIFQSWSRCLRSRHDPGHQVEYQPVTRSRVQLAMQRNHLLVASWQDEAEAIEAALGATRCAAMLTDPSGVIVGAACAGRHHERIIPDATRLGVDLSEEAVGTTAPGLVARTGRQISVSGAEHFFEIVRTMYCAAAPIHDVHGRVAGVLDISSEGAPFVFDAAAVVAVFAATIENRLLRAQSGEHLVVHVQVSPSLLDTPMEGLLGFDFSGRLLWRNASAERLLGLGARSQAAQEQAEMQVESLLGCGLAALLREGGDTFALSLPNGLRVYARVRLPVQEARRWMRLGLAGEEAEGGETTGGEAQGQLDVPLVLEAGTAADTGVEEATARADASAGAGAGAGAGVAEALPEDQPGSPRSFRAANGELIRQALEAGGGNVSAAARALKVSRGLIYRYLREMRREDPAQG